MSVRPVEELCLFDVLVIHICLWADLRKGTLCMVFHTCIMLLWLFVVENSWGCDPICLWCRSRGVSIGLWSDRSWKHKWKQNNFCSAYGVDRNHANWWQMQVCLFLWFCSFSPCVCFYCQAYCLFGVVFVHIGSDLQNMTSHFEHCCRPNSKH